MTVTRLDASARAADRPVPLERIETQIIELASQIAGATCRLLLLVGEFDAREGGLAWGVNSTAHWLSWRCGVGMTAAREQVRVARILRDYPRLVEEFAAGRLSYSKVRAITRAVTDVNVETLIDYARNASAAQLDRIVASFLRAARADNPKAQRAARAVTWDWDSDGCLVGTFRLPPEQGMKLLTALEAARAVTPIPVVEVEEIEAEHTSCDDCTEWNRPCTHASADVHRARRGTRSNADALELMADLTLAAVQGAQQTESAAQNQPAESSDASAEASDHGLIKTTTWLPGLDPSERFQLVIHTSTAAADGSSPVANALLQDGLFNDGLGLAGPTIERISCNCPIVLQTDDPQGNSLHLGRKTRKISGRLAKAVHHRDKGRCRAPGCTNRTSQIHHIWHWSKGGPTCIENLISLCDHHHWLAHEGGWTITTIRPGEWTWQRPDGIEVPTFTPAVDDFPPLPTDPTITADALELLTMSPTFDLSTAVGWLLRAA